MCSQFVHMHAYLITLYKHLCSCPRGMVVCFIYTYAISACYHLCSEFGPSTEGDVFITISCYQQSRNFIPLRKTRVHPRLLVVFVLFNHQVSMQGLSFLSLFFWLFYSLFFFFFFFFFFELWFLITIIHRYLQPFLKFVSNFGQVENFLMFPSPIRYN